MEISDSDETIIDEDFNNGQSENSDRLASCEVDFLLNKYLKDDGPKMALSKKSTNSVSSDDTEEAAAPIDSMDFAEYNVQSEDEIEKYEAPKNSTGKMYSLSSDSENDDLPTFSQDQKKKQIDTSPCISADVGMVEIEETNKKRKNSTKKTQSQDKENVRKQKLEERERKKEEQRRDKAIKDALANHYKNLEPENCLKFIKAHVDLEISGKDYWEDVTNEFQNAGVDFNIVPQNIGSIISWTRQVDSHLLDLNGELIDNSKAKNIDEVLLIIESDDFINKIHEETFTSYIESVCSILVGNTIILAIYGLEKYFKLQKLNKRKELRAQGTSKNKNDELPVISRRAVEYALTDIQLSYGISHRMLETKKDMALFIFQMTKSVAEIPYKRRKQEDYELTKWFMGEDNKDVISVDKNGNGLSRLWKQILIIFPLTNLETAEAISNVYPTPLSLMKAYDNVKSESEGEKLLQDIPIRRTAGPLSTMRNVGPELSQKIYHFFTSIDPDLVL